MKQGWVRQAVEQRAALHWLMDSVCCQQAGKTIQEREE